MADKIAVVGTGLVGSAWAIVFARAGREVVLCDEKPEQAEEALRRVATNVKELEGHGLIDDPEAAVARISVARDLADALDGAVYVQESVFERTDVKQAAYAEMDKVADGTVIIGSSSSGIPASTFPTRSAPTSAALV